VSWGAVGQVSTSTSLTAVTLAVTSKDRLPSPIATISTFAGSGDFSFSDGTGTNAKFNYPFGVTIDSFGNFVLLNWQLIYKGSIRDFFPPVEFLTESKNEFQIYQESLFSADDKNHLEMLAKIGKVLSANELKDIIDFAFLCLHGPYGEDGKIQGLFEYLNIPYSGSGIFSSCIGIDKTIQKKLMTAAGFNSPEYIVIESRNEFDNSNQEILELAKTKIGFPMVIKSATQGSSIGVSIFE
jgi:D-alanine-D-alanine ligase